MDRYYGGSNWSRWDLHVHTPYSILNNGFGQYDQESTWDKYIFTLVTKAKEKRNCSNRYNRLLFN